MLFTANSNGLLFASDIKNLEKCYKKRNNSYLLALYWTEMKHKTRHCQGENLSIFICKMYKEKVIKRKIGNLQMKSIIIIIIITIVNKGVEENIMKIMIMRF